MSRGYKGFVINGTTDQSQAGQFTTPGQAMTTTVVSGGIANCTTTYTPPITQTFFKPGTAVFVTLVQDGGMNARMIYTNLAPKYISDKERLDQFAPPRR